MVTVLAKIAAGPGFELIQPSVYSSYAMGLISWVGTESLPVSCFNCDRQQIASLWVLCNL